MKINENYSKLKETYLFKTIAQKTKEYKEAHPDADIISMGIGDVTLPLVSSAVAAMKSAADDMSRAETFHGYPDSFGEDFLLSAIAYHYKKHIGIDIKASEIVVTSGAKEDVANILDIFSEDNTVLIPDPVYPVYFDTNVMAGRNVKFISANLSNHFLPMPDYSVDADIIYICSPNNPTGAAYSRSQLKEWVKYATEKNAVILYDAAYEMFISDSELPRSIFEIEGADKCAIEFCSFSKTAGFTGVRCGYTVISENLVSGGVHLLDMWKRRQSTKFNGVAYVIQKAAAAVFSDKGYEEIKNNIEYYKTNTKNMMKTFDKLGFTYYGGVNSPYIWLKCPNSMGSWEFFDLMLNECNIIGTPGEGFGENGEGFFRLSGFGNTERTLEALDRIEKKFRV